MLTDRRPPDAQEGRTARALSWFAGWFRTAVPLDLRAWSLAAGFRCSVACSVPLLLAEGLGRPDLSWVAVVSFWGCLVDPSGAWRTRLAALASFTLCATAATFLAVLLRPYLWPSAAFALAWCFAMTIARIWGDAAAGVGTLSGIAYLVALGMDEDSSLALARQLAVLTLTGCVWAMVLALVVWRQHPHTPARRAVARVLHEVAAYVQALAGLLRSGTDNTAWEQVAQERRRACREAIENARRTLFETRRSRAGRSKRVNHLLLILADADRAFARMIALNELLESTPWAAMQAGRLDRRLRLALGRFGEGIAQVATMIEGGTAPTGTDVSAPLAFLRDPGEAPSPLRLHALDLLDQTARWINAAAEHAGPAGASRAAVVAPEAEPPARPWRELRANFTRHSLPLRHSARLAITAAAAVLITHALHLERGYWVTITAVSILQPYLSITWQRTIERIVASVLGGLIAAAIGLVLHRPLEIALLIVPMSVLTLAVRSVSYPLFIFCLTPQFILVAELFQPGGLNPDLAGVRAWDTVIGGLLGLVATFLLWPSHERPQVGPWVARAIRANRDYLLAALDVFAGAPPTVRLDEAQRRAGLASNNAEASTQRLIGEPRAWRADETGPALTSIAAIRRLAGVAAALGALKIAPSAEGGGDDVAALRGWLADGLEAVARIFNGDAPAQPLPPVPPLTLPTNGLLGREFERARRQVLLLEETARRFAAASPP